MATRLTTIVVVASCDLLSPQPKVDVYDVTTTLDTFSFETAAPSEPDCPSTTQMSPYCTHVRAFSGATLTGVLTLVSSGDSLIPSGNFTGKMCTAYSVSAPTGCTSVTKRTDEYGPGFSGSRLHTDRPEPTLFVDMRVGSGINYKPMLAFLGSVRGDSVIGRVAWSARPGRSPPTHSGRFVAVRR